MKNFTYILFFMSGMAYYSCSDTGNEPESPTNTHNTSEPSAAAHDFEPRIDARSRMPASRLNDGNLDTRSRQ
ncbi:hypothetical protein BH23BAC1_BH23BAC1_05360 [soil metagenome]